MSRVLFNPVGTLGDIHPYIAIAQALIAQGHQAVIATQERYRPVIEQAGIDFVPIKLLATEQHHQAVNKAFDTRKGPNYLTHLIMHSTKSVYGQLLEHAQQADLLVSHPLGVALPLIAEKHSIPWASSVLSPMNLMSCYDPPVLPAIPYLYKLRLLGVFPYRLAFNLLKHGVKSWEKPFTHFRAELGLPPSKKMALFDGKFSPALNLALFDAPLALPQPDWPANTKVCGYPVFADHHQVAPHILQEVQNFIATGSPPIIFSLGSSTSTSSLADSFWKTAAQTVHELGQRAIFLTGRPITMLSTSTIRIFPFLPYELVFPHASIIVHQAGLGTLSQAMRMGKPQLALPAALDQLDNAHRLCQLQIAKSLPLRKVTVRCLSHALADLLDHADYCQQAVHLSRTLSEKDAATTAAKQLLAHHCPSGK